MKAADGTQVATATFEFDTGYATVTVETTGTGKLSPGFHGLHIHSVGKCEANSVAPAGGAPGRLPFRRWTFPGARPQRTPRQRRPEPRCRCGRTVRRCW